MAPEPPRVHLVIPTHTTRHLAATLLALAHQTEPPDSIVVTCDTDAPDLAHLLRTCWPKVVARLGRPEIPLLHVSRPHTGVARLNQVRNNGLRALERLAPRDHDLVVTLDGDTVLNPDALARHRALRTAGFDLVIPYRINLEEHDLAEITSRHGDLDRWALDALTTDPALDHLLAGHRSTLEARHARYERQLWARRWLPVFTKPHKPKVLGGHHSVSVRVLWAVNGYDERFTGYGYDDDDLARRIHAIRPKVKTAIAVREAIAFHLWHPTRAPARPTLAPGYATFREPWTPRCAQGWTSPGAQPAVRVEAIAAM